MSKTSGRAGMTLILISRISGACIGTKSVSIMGYVEIPTGYRQVGLRIWRMEAEMVFFLTSYFFFVRHSALLG